MVNFSHDSYDKCGDFDFPITVNFPYLSSNIPESPAYGVFCLTVNTRVPTGNPFQNSLIFPSFP